MIKTARITYENTQANDILLCIKIKYVADVPRLNFEYIITQPVSETHEISLSDLDKLFTQYSMWWGSGGMNIWNFLKSLRLYAKSHKIIEINCEKYIRLYVVNTGEEPLYEEFMDIKLPTK